MRIVIELSLFIAIVTLGLSFILLPKIGIIGAGVDWLASQGIAALIIGWRLFRVRRNKEVAGYRKGLQRW
jgi:O-antigen/teichoic acid export membrane protein